MSSTQTVTTFVLAAALGFGGGFLGQSMGEQPAAARAPESRPPPVQLDRIEAALDRLGRRLDVLERQPAAAPEPETEIEVSRAERPEERERRQVAERRAKQPARILEGMLAGDFDYDDSTALFARLAKHRGAIDATVAKIEAAIKQDPNNADLHCALATALSAKTAYATPPGPEQGLVWQKTIAAYDKAIELDPDHWNARYGKAFGASMAPEFVGMRPAAIRGFEKLVEIQERQAQRPEHVLVFVRLGALYKSAGNTRRAREVWEQGRLRFPDEKQLKDALEMIGEEE